MLTDWRTFGLVLLIAVFIGTVAYCVRPAPPLPAAETPIVVTVTPALTSPTMALPAASPTPVRSPPPELLLVPSPEPILDRLAAPSATPSPVPTQTPPPPSATPTVQQTPVQRG